MKKTISQEILNDILTKENIINSAKNYTYNLKKDSKDYYVMLDLEDSNGFRPFPPKEIARGAYKIVYPGKEMEDDYIFYGGEQVNTIFEKKGFSIINKQIYDLINVFLQNTKKSISDGALSTSNFEKNYSGYDIVVSFGKGGLAKIPWISFLKFNQTTSNGIYPVYLYYKDLDYLILAYGVSEFEKPQIQWKKEFIDNKETINELFVKLSKGKPYRYGSSYVYTLYDNALKKINDGSFYKELKQDLDNILQEYDENFSSHENNNMNNNQVNEKEEKYELPKKNNKQPLNQILYGPPGTGKTYHTINKAISIIDPAFDLSQNREIIKEKFKELVNKGQIVFTTFHQNMSYEDFIEGIKPSTNEEGSICYDIQPGIFKKISERANENLSDSFLTKEQRDIKKNFKEALNNYIDKINKEISEGKTHQINNTIAYIYEITDKGFRYTSKNWPQSPLIRIDDLEKMAASEKINHKERSSMTKHIFDLDVSGTCKHDPTYAFRVYEEVCLLIKKNSTDTDKEDLFKKQNYVLIIDEINRGNVSQIFGELITLIEEDKRLGEEEELTVVLPYSKAPFGVPSNLYIIGTMNTADRSVEALDTALRRRFSFEEMLPDVGQIEDNASLNIEEIFKKINSRVEKLLDRDHLIGHSYFMKIETIEELHNTFKNKVIPLLQEYFYGDYGKIGLVLGEGFFEKNKNTSADIFAKFDSDISFFEDKINYNFKKFNINDDSFKEEFIKAIEILLQ